MRPSALFLCLAPLALSVSPAFAKGDAEAGRKAYAETCENCHGDKGQGNPVMYKRVKAKIVHLGSEEAQQKSDESIRKAIVEGVGKMETVEDLKAGQIDNVIAFVRSLRLDKSKAAGGAGAPAAGALAAAPATAPGAKAPAGAPTGAKKVSGDSGRKVYAESCENCHGDKGQGNPVMYKRVKAKIVHLGSKEAQQKSDASIRKSITDGWEKMEAVEGLSAQQVEDVIAFMRTLKLEEPKH